jgi:hypothetical protein
MTARIHRHTTRAARAGLAAAVILGALAGVFGAPAHRAKAAVFAAPAGGHNIFTLPQQDAITLVNAPSTAVTVTVVRAGVVVGQASGTTDTRGIFQVNHPGGVCFSGSTPLLQPQDVVQVVGAAGIGEQTTVQNVTAGRAALVGTNIVVHGTAADALGNPLPVTSIESRLVSKTALFATNHTRTLRAGAVAVRGAGALSFDAPGSTAWTATYAGLSAGDIALALAADGRGMWLGAVPGLLNETTVYDVGFVPAPIPACLAVAPLSAFSVTGIDRAAVNLANAGTPLVVSGTAANAGAPTVTLDDANPLTPAITVTPVVVGNPFASTWTATFTPAQIATLTDGTLTVSATYTPPGGLPLPGGTRTLVKDTVAPGALTATPAPGLSLGGLTARLANADPTAVIHMTTDGVTVADATSPVYNPATGIVVPSGTITVSALAVDPAGNPGPVSTFTWTVAQATITGADRPSVSIATASQPLTFSGTAVNAPAVTISLDDTSAATPAVSVPTVLTGPLSAQTWTATFTPAQIGSLADGVLTAKAMLSTVAASSFTVIKKTAAPPSPNASLASGTYQGVRSTTLADGDPNATIWYTTDGTVPAPGAVNSTQYGNGTAIAVGGGTTTLSALAVDAVGNVGPVASFTWNIIFGTTVSATSLDLGVSIVGQSAGPAFVTVTNASANPVVFTSATSSSAEFAIGGGTCAAGATIAPNATCTIGVSFAPGVTGSRTGTLTVLDSSPTGRHTVALTGVGGTPIRTIALSATTLAFNKVVNNTTANQVVTVTSTGNSATPVTATLAGANATQYSVTSNCPAALAPRATCTLTLTFHPTVRANANATLSVAGGSNATVVTIKGSVK